MYLGRERLGTRKAPIAPIRRFYYENPEEIKDVVDRIKEDYPEFNDLQARLWEIISRFRGENGLSANNVSYLVSAIYQEVS